MPTTILQNTIPSPLDLDLLSNKHVFIAQRRETAPKPRGGFSFWTIPLLICIVGLLSCLIGCGRSLHEQLKLADALSQQAEELILQRKYNEAIQTFHELGDTYRQLHRDSAFAETSYRLAELYREIGNYDSAFFAYYRAVDAAQTSFHKTLDRQIKFSLAQLSFETGKFTEAKSLANELARAAQFVGDNTLYLTAQLLSARASHTVAAYAEEVKILDEIESQSFFSTLPEFVDAVFEQRMKAYSSTNQLDSARRVYLEWKTASLGKQDTLSFVRAQYQWAKSQERAGNFDSATAILKSILKYHPVYLNETLMLRVMESLAMLVFRTAKYSEARYYLQEGLMVAKAISASASELSLQLLSLWTDVLEDPFFKKTSVTIFQEQCKRLQKNCEDFHLPRELALSLYLQGKAAEAQKHLATALKFYYRALDVREKYVLHYSDEYSIWQEDDIEAYFDAALSIECSVGNVDSVFSLIERKILYDIVRFFSQLSLTTGNEKLNNLARQSQIERYSLAFLERSIREEILEPQEKNFERLQLLSENSQAILTRVSMIEQEIQSASSQFARLFSLRPLTLYEARELLFPHSSLVEFLPLQDALYALLIRKDTAIVKRLPFLSTSVRSMAAAFAASISDVRLTDENISRSSLSEERYRIETLSSELYRALFAPIEVYLNKTSVLYIVSPKEFGFLPYHTLTDNTGRQPIYLAGRYEIRYLPTASVLAFPLPTKKVSVQIAGLGHPGYTSWDVEYELKDIWAFQREAKLFYGTDAALDLSRILPADVLQVVAEIGVDSRYPRNSKIVLPDETSRFRLRDISLGTLGLLGKIPTVVVSNIADQPGQLQRYLPMLVLASGTKSCIATFWQGERKGKKYFGEVFYTGLLLGMSADEAYRESVNSLMKEKEFSESYRWGLYYYFGR
jgi:tetratricopeptide (TPR) repeat protein